MASGSADSVSAIATFLNPVTSVSQKVATLVDDNNFLAWKQHVLLVIKTHRLHSYIDGFITIPPRMLTSDGGASVENPAFIQYEQQDSALSAWLLSTISASLHNQLIASCNHHVSLAEQQSAIINGLPPEFDHIVSTITTSQIPFDLQAITTALLDAEARQQAHFSQAQISANLAMTNHSTSSLPAYNNHPPLQSFCSTRVPVFSRGRGRSRFRGMSRPQCQICGKMGHVARRCFYRYDSTFDDEATNDSGSPSFGSTVHAGTGNFSAHLCHTNQFTPNSYPPGTQFVPSTLYQPVLHLPVASSAGPPIALQTSVASTTATPSVVSDLLWYPDSGATAHMTSDPVKLTNCTSYTGQGKVLVGNGSYASIFHVGDSSISSSSHNLSINNLLFVPAIHKSLLSISKFAKDNQVFFEFHPSCCYVKDLATHRILLHGIESNRLYQLLPESSTEFAFTASNKLAPSLSVSSPLTVESMVPNSTIKITRWHQRLGHPSTDVLNHVLRACNISIPRSIEPSLCNTCALGKSHKLPFNSVSTVYSVPLELIFTDLWGPAPCFSAGYQYYISFHVELQLGTKIKQLQSDGGGEFRSFDIPLKKFGIQHRFSCPHTSEQNGIVERRHRQIVETDLILLAQASLPLSYWVDAFTSAVYLMNLFPTKSLHGLSPMEKLFNKQPDYKFLKVFGCLCYPLLRPYNKHKLQFRSSSCTFLGYAANYRGYKCVDKTGRIYISRHVQFDEGVFPYAKLSLVPPITNSNTSESVSTLPVIIMPLPSTPPPSHDSMTTGSTMSPSVAIPTENFQSPTSTKSNDVGNND
ncbi:hypothetical protein CXB51_035527 [Gossypium anomalum]|uniref:Retrovirus-related Pol polyprotein from transposon TNT 1-94 n=1 Tax=Gossypium anomalum TaxID=47600 RepID=A0A8J5Y8L1_9ROSI|nr:hypothetical protein CXB51_035527 [Gossypium anomalum]